MANGALREIVASFGFDVDDDKLKQLDDSIDSVKSNMKKMTIAAIAAVGALTGVTISSAQAGEELALMSERLGVSVEALQQWDFIAGQAGVSSGSMTSALETLRTKLLETNFSLTEAGQALVLLGVETKDAEGNLKSIEHILPEITKALSEQEDAFIRDRLAEKIFAGAAQDLIQISRLGAEEIDRLAERALILSNVFTSENVEASKELSKSWKELIILIKNLKNALGKTFEPALTKVIKTIVDFTVENSTLIKSLAVIISLTTAAVASVGAMTTAMVLFGNAAFLANLKLLAIPLAIGAIIAAVGLIIEDLKVFSEGGESLFGGMIEDLNEVLKEIGLDKTFIFIWEDAKVAFSKFLTFVKGNFKIATGVLTGDFDLFIEGVRESWDRLGYAIIDLFTKTIPDAIIAKGFNIFGIEFGGGGIQRKPTGPLVPSDLLAPAGTRGSQVLPPQSLGARSNNSSVGRIDINVVNNMPAGTSASEATNIIRTSISEEYIRALNILGTRE